VVELITDEPRQSHDDDARKIAALIEESLQAVEGAALEQRLLEKIRAGVPGESEFREDEDVNLLARRRGHQLQDAAGVVGTVGDAHAWHGGRHPDEAVLDHGSRRSLLTTTSPPSTTASARPRTTRPWKGVLRLFERNCSASIVHVAFGSITVTSAIAPGR